MPFSRTEPLRREIRRAFPERPFTLELWDGTRLEASNGGGLTLRMNSPKAIAHALLAPGELGIGRAYVTGMVEVDDIDAAIGLIRGWSPPALDGADRVRLVAAAVRACGLMRPPRPPAAELRPAGRHHSPERDARAVRHHYDVANEFFALFLDRSMTYSCAVFSSGATTLEEAQEAKLELVCSKLALGTDDRVLDVGCGWGSFGIHAASRHGARVLGITLSEPQAREATRRAREAGVDHLTEFRVADYRELTGERFDAIASIGMVEHVGESQIDGYARRLAELLKPGGRLLNHGITRLRHTDRPIGPFTQRYVFPDGELLHVSRVVLALERAGFEIQHVEGLREDYAETLRHWARNLDAHLDEAIRIAGPERVRVWRLYLRAAGNGFSIGFTSLFQVRAALP